MPALRRGSPISALAPTPHSRPIASATSASPRSPIVGSVTTAISAPVAARSRSIRSSMRASEAPSMTPATSVTVAVRPCGKQSSDVGLLGERGDRNAQLKRRHEGGSFGSCPAQDLSWRWSWRPIVACEGSHDVAVRVSIPGPDSTETPASAVGLVALPYDRDSVLAALEAAAPTKRPATAELDSLFDAFRGPFIAYSNATRQDHVTGRLPGRGEIAARLDSTQRPGVCQALRDVRAPLRFAGRRQARRRGRPANAGPGARRVRSAEREPARGDPTLGR